MAEDKKYYYLKLKENFFDSDEIKLLESVENGYLYSNILLKMFLKSLKSEGRLMFRENIPYNSKMLAAVTGHNIDVVDKAIKVFIDFGLIQILDSGAIYIADIQSYIGESSTEADRKREYRLKIEAESKLLGQMSGQMSGHLSDERPPELDIEKDKELELNNNPPQPLVAKPKKEKTDLNYSQDFEEAFIVYPHRQGDGDEKDKVDAWAKWRGILKKNIKINDIVVNETVLLECARNYADECAALKREEEYHYKITNFYGKLGYYKKYLIKKPIKINGGFDEQRNRKPTAAEHHAAVSKLLNSL